MPEYKTNEVTNYFISHTFFQTYVATHMIKSHPDFIGCHNVLVCPEKRLYSDLSAWSKVITPPMSLFSNTGFVGISSNIQLANELIHEMFKYKKARVLICNLWSPMNRIMSALTRKHKNIDLCAYPEGLANMLIPQAHGLARIKEVGKTILLNIQGVPYRYTKFTSGETRCDKVYTFSPELMMDIGIPAERLDKISLSQQSTRVLDNRKCLIVGQGGDIGLTAHEIEKCRGMVDVVIDDLGCTDIYYKEHPISGQIDEALKPNKYIGRTINGPKIVEDMIEELNCGVVISLYSSSLFNLKLMYGQDITCVSINGDVVLSRHHMYGKEWMERYRNICRAFDVKLSCNLP